jgi:ABC-2 type transport system permease protein
MILVVMYGIITRGEFATPLFSYMYIGNAFYIFVGRIMNGLGWAVIDDREHYKTLKYIYTAPVRYPTYLLGRGVASLLSGSIAVVVTLIVGVAFLKVQINLLEVNWLLFIAALVIGILMLSFMALMLAGLMMMLAHHLFGIGEAIAASLYLFTGAIFPLEVLPAWLRWFGYVLPITYWLELVRRSLVGQVAGAFPTLQSLSDMQILGILVGLTVVFGGLSFVTFAWFERQARERGLLDMVTNY